MARLDILATTPRQIVASFGAVILTGSLLLWLPLTAQHNVAHVSYIDALFTATSAVCVTGLTVRDPGTTFSFSGQLIILLLIQLGGLGILTLTNLFFHSQARQLNPVGRQQVEASMGNMRDVHPRELLRKMIRYTIAIELLGTLLLFFRFGQQYPLGHAGWLAVFHAVSAFCNAGFGLFSNNLMDYRDDFLVNLVVMGLIVSGGLGFIVYADLSTFRHRRLAGLRPKLSLHTRMVLQVTAFLILGGGLVLALLELGGQALGGANWAAWHTGLFLAVTARTAGFNTVDTSLLSNPTLLVLAALMVIGGSPGGTAGGLKTTTFGTIWALGWSRLRHRRRTEFGGNTLSEETVTKAIMSAGGYLVTLIIGTLLIQILQMRVMPPQVMRENGLGLFFETASALGTVGLSTGVTPQLTVASKLVLIFMMLMGRVGPLLFAATLVTHRPQPQYTLPEDSVNIG
jgi:trk system potassium uptake protein